jgi:probable addiction module antidote protein
MNKGYADYHEQLIEELKDPEEALAYLNAALEDEDERVFLLALKNVLEAQGGSMTRLSKKAKLNRENLHRMLSKKGNPNWNSITTVIKAMNLQLAIQQSAK